VWPSNGDKIRAEPEELERIAQRVAEYSKPLVISAPRKGPAEDEFLSVEEEAILLKTKKARIHPWVNSAQHGLGDLPFQIAARQLRHPVSARVG
jgi:hypothetical protein